MIEASLDEGKGLSKQELIDIVSLPYPLTIFTFL
jgi:hypothetical protein